MPESDLDVRRKRAYFLSWHRGTREMDLLIGRFADHHLASLTPEQLERYEALLQVPDAALYAWITGLEDPPADHDTDVLRWLCNQRLDPVNG